MMAKNLLKGMLICLFHYQHFQTGQFSLLVFLKAALLLTDNSHYFWYVTSTAVRNLTLADVPSPWSSSEGVILL